MTTRSRFDRKHSPSTSTCLALGIFYAAVCLKFGRVARHFNLTNEKGEYMNEKLNRRHFLKNSAAVIGGLVMTTPLLAQVGSTSFFGSGYYGMGYYAGGGYFGMDQGYGNNTGTGTTTGTTDDTGITGTTGNQTDTGSGFGTSSDASSGFGSDNRDQDTGSGFGGNASDSSGSGTGTSSSTNAADNNLNR